MTAPRPRKSLARGLVDVRFTQMITPRLVGCLYVAAAGLVGLGALAGVALIAGLSGWLGAGWLIFAPVVIAAGAVGLLLARVACEWLLMAFTRGRALSDGEAASKADRAADGRWRQKGENGDE
ncbi:DUF4282 domain-containing protein [Actinomadura sp. 9N407]|uniref:DUF4282 domain-containing protein n=1 Tax=Actinomadura sp. 9N407 TaxID=3375154 RepID=UPI0037A2826A